MQVFKFDTWFSLESLRVVVPLLGVTFAILYNIGFFSAIGLAWFSIFSLSEHVVFAARALPVVFLIIALFYGLLLLVEWSFRPNTDDQARVWRARHLVRGMLTVTLLILLGFGLYYGEYVWVAILVVVSLLLVLVGYSTVKQEYQAIMLGYAVFLCIMLAFGFGAATGHAVARGTSTPYILYRKNAAPIPGMLILAAQSGVLFVTGKSQKISFHRWDTVDRVERDEIPPMP